MKNNGGLIEFLICICIGLVISVILIELCFDIFDIIIKSTVDVTNANCEQAEELLKVLEG